MAKKYDGYSVNWLMPALTLISGHVWVGQASIQSLDCSRADYAHYKLSFIFSSTSEKHIHLLVCQMGVFPICNMHVNFNSKTSYQRLHLVVQVLLLPFLWVQVTEPLMRTQKQIEEVRCWGAMATKQRQRQTGQLCERGAMRKRDNARGR